MTMAKRSRDNSINDDNFGLSDKQLKIIQRYSHVELHILQKMYNSKYIGGCEISEGDLIKGTPSHLKGDVHNALKNLSQVLIKKSHAGCGHVYSLDPLSIVVKDEDYHIIFERIRESKEFKDAIMDSKINIIHVDEGIQKLVDQILTKKKSQRIIHEYHIKAVDVSKTEDIETIKNKLDIIFNCPRASVGQDSRMDMVTFIFQETGEFYTKMVTVEQCNICKHKHILKANGRIN